MDAGLKKRIALQVEHLAAVRFGNTGIAEEHRAVSQTVVCATDRRPRLTGQATVTYPIS
jgi:hypothetical protein